MSERDPRPRSSGRQLSLEPRPRSAAASDEPPRSGGTTGPREVPSVSQLVRAAAQQLESRFGAVWVEGEVSNLRRPASGHLYFTLKDQRAQLPAVLFRSAAQRLRFAVEDGQTLRCRGRLTIYPQQGRFQLTCEHAEPTGVGALQLAFEQLKRKLAAEGLFDERHKRPLPRFPRAIALVTSRSGAALRDILRVLQRRYPLRVVLVPTVVQGPDAAPEIVEGLRRADRLGVDLIIVGRGGGSLEDLWAFNNEGVARAIHSARTPVIAAVGHEVDVTITDLVADRRAPTPSAAAELAVPVRDEVAEMLAMLTQRLGRGVRRQVAIHALELERQRRRLGSPRSLVDRGRMQLDDAQQRLSVVVTRALAVRRRDLDQLRVRLNAQRPAAQLARDRARLDASLERLAEAMRRQLDRRAARVARLAGQLDALSPLAVLGRGYSLAHAADGALLRDASQVAVGDGVELRLARGRLGCRVDRVEPASDSE